MQELEFEAEKFKEETQRLRSMLDRATQINKEFNFEDKSMEERFILYQNTIKTLKKDNIEMAALI